MIGNRKKFCALIALACALAWPGFSQSSGSTAAQAAPAGNRADAYYNFAMGHLYAELAGTYGFRSEYVDKAIQHYRAAMKADPSAAFLAEELTDLFIQAGRLREAVSEAEDILKREPDNLEARRMLGRIYSRLIGDPQQNRIKEDMLRMAIEQYERISEKDAKDIDAWLMLGRLYKIQQNSLQAEKAYQTALEIDPKNEFALSGLALVYSDLGDASRAIEMWRRLAETNPHPRTLRALAQAYEQAQDYAGAAGTLRRALEMAPRDLELKKSLAENLLMAEQVDEALKLFEEVSQADPKDARIPLRISQIYRQKRELAKAREAYTRARELEPDSLEVRYHEVNLLEAEGQGADAIARLKEILDATAKSSYAPSERANRAILVERLGLLYRANERFDEAVKAFQTVPELDPNAAARAAAQVADTYRQSKQFAKAQQEAEAAVKKFPDDRTVRLVRASVLADVGRADEAAAEMKQLLDGKNDRETWLALAQIYEKGKNYGEMDRALEEAHKLSGSAEEREVVYFMRGAMFERMKKHDEAEAEFRRVLEINPRNASALNYLGYMFADRNVRLEEAQQLIERALELEPNNGAYLDSLGWVYFRLGRLEDAEYYLRRALERVSRDPVVHDHLGDVYLQQGKLKEAIAQWEISLREWEAASRADLDPTEVAKIQKKLESAKIRLAKEASGAPRRRQQ